MTCNRMLIMYQGQILAADSPENLQRLMSGTQKVIAEVAAPEEELRQFWASMPDVDQFDISAAEGQFFRCALTPRDGHDLRPQVYAAARDHGWTLRELTLSRHSLEDIYVQVTKSDEEDEA